MFHLATANPWFLKYDFHMAVDFCIWVLETDGLHVGPFDQHAEGDGSLRAVGLDAQGWRLWFTQVVDTHYQFAHTLQQQHKMWHEQMRRQLQQKQQFSQAHQLQPFVVPHPPMLDIAPTLISKVSHPATEWTGNAEVGRKLAEMWNQYTLILNERKAWLWKHTRADETTKRLWTMCRCPRLNWKRCSLIL